MKKNEKKELATRTGDELVKSLRDLRSEVAQLSIAMKMRKVENTNIMRQKKKDIARILTILKMKVSVN